MKKIGFLFFCFFLFCLLGGAWIWADQYCVFDFLPGKKVSFALQDLLEKRVSCVLKRIDFYQLNFWIKTWSKQVAEKSDFFLGERFESLKKFDQDLRTEYAKLQDQAFSKSLQTGTLAMRKLQENVFQMRSDSELFPFMINPANFILEKGISMNEGQDPAKHQRKWSLTFMGNTVLGSRGLFYFAEPKVKNGIITFSLFNAERSPVALRFTVFNRLNTGDKGERLIPWSDWISAGESAILSFDVLDDRYFNKGVFVQIEHNGSFWQEEKHFYGLFQEGI